MDYCVLNTLNLLRARQGKTLKSHDNANIKEKTLKSHDIANLKGKTKI
jgi:hypothetical protein